MYEQVSKQRWFEINQRIEVPFWDKQAVSRKNWTVIEESEALIIFEDDGGGYGPTCDLAKDAGFHALKCCWDAIVAARPVSQNLA